MYSLKTIFNHFPHSFLAVQINHCPGSGDRLCCCSTGGPYPTILNGQRNSQDAFVNSVPTTTLAKMTIKGLKKIEGVQELILLLHKQDSNALQNCPLLHPAFIPINHYSSLFFLTSVAIVFSFQILIVFLLFLLINPPTTLRHEDSSIE